MNSIYRKNFITLISRLGLARLAKTVKCHLLHILDAHDDATHIGGLCPQNLTYRLAHLALLHHRIEKGLCMPQFRPGFGQDVIWQIISSIQDMQKRGVPSDCPEIKNCISVLLEYKAVHQSMGYVLPDELAKALENFSNSIGCLVSPQLDMTPDEYWANNEAAFPLFAASRHSVRHFSGKVDSSLIDKSIALACTAPTACNRQHVRIHTYEDEQAAALLAYQNGNKGFGHLCKQLIVVTTDKNALYTMKERHDAYTNGGIFAMNLSYSLHYHRVAHCILNWSSDPGTNSKFKSAGRIPENEAVVLLIACGNVPENFKVARSPRKPASQIHTKH